MKPSVVPFLQQSAPIPPENLITVQEMARRLRPDLSEEGGVSWVREMFDWIQVSEWIRSSPRPVHARHHRRKKSEEKKAA
jgi:hypothetical protein